MKNNLIYITWGILLFASCATSDIYSDHDESVDFSKYRSFAWYPSPHVMNDSTGFNNELIENNIKNQSTAILGTKGYRLDIDKPDLIFEYHIMVQKKLRDEQQPVYSHPYNYYYYDPYNPY